MDETTEVEYVKIKTIIQKPRITKIDLKKINTFLGKTSLIEEYFIVRLFILSFESGHYEISNLILPKFEDISNGFIQGEFLSICTRNDLNAIQYLFSKGFIIEDLNYKLLLNLAKVKTDTINMIKEFQMRKKIEKIKSKITQNKLKP